MGHVCFGCWVMLLCEEAGSRDLLVSAAAIAPLLVLVGHTARMPRWRFLQLATMLARHDMHVMTHTARSFRVLLLITQSLPTWH